MSAVDVLAVMDAAAYELHDYTTGSTQAQPLSEARAAVAELIEAHKRLTVAARNAAGHVPSVEGALRQSDAALARVGGAA